MRIHYTYYFLLLTLFSLSTYAQLNIGDDYAPQQILVQFERSSGLQEREALRKSFQAQELQYFENLDSLRLIIFSTLFLSILSL